MSEAIKLVEVIEELERQSEELNSAIDLYREINSLYAKISNTSEKYEKLFDDINKAKLSLKEANKNIKNTLESANHEEVLEQINSNINENYKTTSDNIKLLKLDSKYINTNVVELNKTTLSLKGVVERSKSEYDNKLDKSLKKLEDNILLNQDNKNNEVIEFIDDRLKTIEEDYKKNVKNIYIGLGIISVISIVNIFIK